ncbi:hypothetical protein PEC18_15940 [Paucibacter sp. O1-1]|nr:hypothetical protein [Paucibacter sp. O1-1]MDA3827304.1 hypothetical protein [Paucibacter sp. O1-1]
MKPSLSKPLLLLGLVVLAGQAAAQQQVLSVGQAPGTPGYTYTYGGLPYSSSTRYNPQPGKVLQMSWLKDATNTTGLVSAELGRLRVAEFGSGRAYATDGSLFGIGGNLRQASFEDTLSLEGAGLNANTVMRIDYHFGAGPAGASRPIQSMATGWTSWPSWRWSSALTACWSPSVLGPPRMYWPAARRAARWPAAASSMSVPPVSA